MVQIMGDKAIPKEGKHAYDKYMDSIELSRLYRLHEKAPAPIGSGRTTFQTGFPCKRALVKMGGGGF